MDWSEGYVVDIDYTYSFFEELNPTWIAFALARKGFAPPNYDKFNYCELGFGQGFGANLFASVHPQGKFWGTDFNPNHACQAELLAQKASLNNVNFCDRSFEEFLNTETPQFDFIVLHGIYTWVDRKNQEIITEFLRRKLKFGGVVYISYNTLPGWAAASPLQRLMFEYAEQSQEPTIDRIEKTVAFIKQLQENEPLFFKTNPVLKPKVEQIAKFKNLSSNYLIHEYFSQHWKPLYFFEVAQHLADAKLTFATSSIIGDEFVTQRFNDKQLQLIAEIKKPELRETVKDYFTNRVFRKDLFVRGTRKLSAREQKEILSKFRFTLVKASMADIKYEIDEASAKVTLEKDVFEPLMTEMDGQALTIEELLERPTVKGKIANFVDATDVLSLLIALGYVKPYLPIKDEASRRSSIEKFNEAVLERSIYGAELKALASPLIGSGIEIDRIEQLFVLAYKRQIDPIEFVCEVLKSGGQTITKDGQIIKTEAEVKVELQERWHKFKTDLLPVLAKWQIV